MNYVRMAIEKESPEELGYGNIRNNLSESSVTDAVLGDLQISLRDLTLLYCEHMGLPALRERIAADHPGIRPEHVLVTAGAASALFILHTTLLERGDHLIVAHPNYGTNIETPRAIGAEVELLPLTFEAGFQPDLEDLARRVRPNTRLISVTTPHNPAGVRLSEERLRGVLDLAERAGCTALVDETYRDISGLDLPPLAAAQSPRAVSVSSMSKAYGLPGIRVGWLICRDEALMERLLAAKEQIFICNSVVDETIALRFLERRDDFIARIRAHTAANFAQLDAWMARQSTLEWVRPDSACVCFPRFKPQLRVDTDRFYRLLLEEHGTLVGPGHWFDMPDTFMRIGYGWPSERCFADGLAGIEAAAAASVG